MGIRTLLERLIGDEDRRPVRRPEGGPVRNPDEPHGLDTIDDWILFGPRMH